MSTRLRFLAAALVAGVALSLAPTAPAVADEGPVVRQPRVRVAPPRVRAVHHVRTVERVRYVPVYYTTGCGGCAAVAPVPQPVYYAPRYYAAGCGGCGHSVALPYYWAVRYARVRHGYHHY
jgi:hypothetical protein